MRRTSKSDPHRRLLRALLEMAGPETEPIGSSSRSWASVTFTGAQHEFELFLMGKDAHDRANKLAECLPEAEFVVAGHIVVDATVDRLSCSQGDAGEPLAFMTVSLLTVEDW
ncbi:MAG TPA: hypothetical protein VIR65_13955 [Rhizorhapis sp.]